MKRMVMVSYLVFFAGKESPLIWEKFLITYTKNGYLLV